MKIKDYANLFALDGYWRYKRAEKKKIYTDKSMKTREAVMKNWIVPLWGGCNPKRLTVQIIDKAKIGMTSPDGEVKTLFPENHAELKRLWRTQKYICAFLILRDTGLRPGELIALKWRDWNSDIKFFSILRAIESGRKSREKETKTGTAKPAITADRTAAEIETLRRKVKPKPDDYIFANKYGIPYSTHRLSWNFRKALERAGLNRTELTPYWLRHTFNSMMLEANSTETVQLLMGHNTEAMTRRYRHAGAESLARTAVKIRAQVNACRLY
jgi:integrase